MARALLATRPTLGIILTSGSHDEPDHGLGPRVRFLRKPTKFSALVDVVREALESR